jgi:hypothetical protein
MPEDRTTLAQLQEQRIRRLLVACKRCSRLDSYEVRRLLAEHGAATELPDLLAALTTDCPWRSGEGAAAGCSAVYCELPVLFGAER